MIDFSAHKTRIANDALVLFLKAVPLQRHTLIGRFMGPTLSPSGTDRTQVGPMLAPWTLFSGQSFQYMKWHPGHKMVEIFYDLLVCTMGLTLVVRWHFYIEINLRKPFKFNDATNQYSKFSYNDNLDSMPFYLNDEFPNKEKIISVWSCLYNREFHHLEW